MMTRALLLATTLCLLPGLACAEPILRGDITVTAAVVTVGDMFADAGDLAEEGLFRAPAPGTAGTVTLADIEAAAARLDILAFDSAGIDAVRVARAGVAIDEAMIADLIVADLEMRGIMREGMSLTLSLDAALPEIVAPAVDAPIAVELVRYHPAAGTLTARFAIAETAAPLEISGRVEMMVEAPHLIASVAAGAILSPADIEMRAVPVTYAETGGLAALDELVGMQVRRNLRDGVLLRSDDVTQPELIARNADVTIVYRSGVLTLTSRGQALNAASLNGPVSVLNPMTRTVLQGIATGSGLVTILSGPQTVAGL